ncbi:alpha-E domain-containing protein [Devosia algicola]|uniref:Alpha-E domain-containing protein n=1 Tax=Devosia algicola TaxID=3026418 RepID=A0ABY7YMA0_9HYPH|nr:alpha-E domain-containing protein [Devosia algicola]WDR02414.1 alpha-E domain-containing protein [Devosia algicola]
MSLDIQQWTLILRAASAHRSYRHVYHDRYKAHNIADFLILRPEMPRSLSLLRPDDRGDTGWTNQDVRGQTGMP